MRGGEPTVPPRRTCCSASCQVLELLEGNPNLGALYDAKHFEGPVRRVLMKRTERHVYYGRLGDDVIILAVWGARRGRGPKL